MFLFFIICFNQILFDKVFEHNINLLMMQETETMRAVKYKQLKVSSKAFQYGGQIPQQYTCDGRNMNPSLDIESIPEDAECLALIMDDPDAPSGIWVHWVVWNIPVTHHIKENIIHGVVGINDFQQHHYGGPCPPSGTHRYFFKVYALNTLLNITVNSKKADLEKAMSGHIIAYGELMGTYGRSI